MPWYGHSRTTRSCPPGSQGAQWRNRPRTRLQLPHPPSPLCVASQLVMKPDAAAAADDDDDDDDDHDDDDDDVDDYYY